MADLYTQAQLAEAAGDPERLRAAFWRIGMQARRLAKAHRQRGLHKEAAGLERCAKYLLERAGAM